MPTFDNGESGASIRQKLNETIIAIESIDTGDVDIVADNIADVGTVATNITDVNTVAGISADVTVVANIDTDVTAVAADSADIGVVSTNISDVNSVATNISDVQSVASDEADIGTVSTNILDVNTVASISGDVTSVSGVSADVATVAGISSDVTVVAADQTDIGTVATNIADVSTTAGSITNVNTVGNNISDVNTVSSALDQPLSAASGVSYDNSSSGLSASDVQGAIDSSVSSFLGRKEQIAQGFIQREGTRGDLDIDLAVAIELNLLGAPVAGGYYAGLIDTIAGDIIAADDYQTGLRYALIVAPKSLEGGRGASPASGLPTGDLEWDTQDRGGEAGCFTRWNGLEATNVIIAKNDTSYEVHDFIEAVRSQYPAVSTPGGTEWYLPAMDELELLYRNFKPNNADNDTRDFPRNFPGSNPSGRNLSSVPEGFNYENNPRIPDVTYLDLFKEGNAQSIDLDRYWSTTDADEGGRAWNQRFTLSGAEGLQNARFKDRDFNS